MQAVDFFLFFSFPVIDSLACGAREYKKTLYVQYLYIEIGAKTKEFFFE
jgi:hypothetical protein